MIYAATGHRPDKLGGYSDEAAAVLVKVATDFLTPRRDHVKFFISGMALGWDQACARACIDLGIPLIAAIPFMGQPGNWPIEAKRKWLELVESATEVKTISPGPYSAQKMQIRNRWMVERCDHLLAMWDGVSEGGTMNSIRYAVSKGKSITNLHGNYMRQAAMTALGEMR